MASTTVPSSGRRRSALLSLATAAALVAGTVVTGTVATVATATAAPAPAAAASAVPVAPAAAAAPAARGVTTGVSGQVVDALTGRPVADAVVAIGVLRPAVVRTDGRGVFTVATPAGAAPVRVLAAGYRDAARLQPVQVSAGAVSSGVVIRLTPRGSLSGTVLDDRGRGRGAVTVVVVDATGATVRSGATDARGRWSVTGLQPGRYRVRYDGAAAGLVDAWQVGTSATARVITVADGSRTPLVARLDRGVTLRGTARDRFGRVVPGAVVGTAIGGATWTTTADARGRWEIRRVPAGHAVVTVRSSAARGVVSVGWTSPVVGATAEVSARPVKPVAGAVVAGATPVTGRLVDPAARPVAGIVVLVVCHDFSTDEDLAATTRSDAAGRFAISVRRGPLLCGLTTSDPAGRYLPLEPGSPESGGTFLSLGRRVELGTLRLEPGASFSGRITAVASGRGVPGQVLVTGTGSALQEYRYAVLRAAADGTYRVAGLHPGAYEVQFVPDDRRLERGYWRRGAPVQFGGFGATRLELQGGRHPETVDAAMRAGATLAGTVRSRSGRALRDVEVVPVRGGVAAGPATPYTSDGPAAPATATTDAQGRWTLPQLPAGRYQLAYLDSSWSDTGALSDHGPAVDLPLGGTRTGIDVVLDQTAALAGVLRGTDGRPVQEGYVTAECGTDDLFPAETITDEDGSWALGGLTGQDCAIGVAAHWDDPVVWLPGRTGPAGATRFPITAGVVRQLDLRVPRLVPGSVTGRVTSTEARTAGLTVVLVDDWSGQQVTTATDADGSYRFPSVLPATYHLAVVGLDAVTTWAPAATRRSQAEAVDVTAGRAAVVDVAVGRAASFSGTVRTHGGGTVLPRLTVVDAATGESVDFRVRGTAPFTVTGLAPGRYRVAASGRDDVRWNGDAEQFVDAAPLLLTAGSTTTGVDITLDAVADAGVVRRAVSGRVDTGGQLGTDETEGSQVVLVDSTGGLADVSEVRRDGSFSTVLAPGDYRAVWFGTPEVAGASTPFRVSSSGRQPDVVLRPGPAATLTLELRTDDGTSSIGGVQVAVADSQGIVRSGLVSSATTLIEGLATGPATVYVFAVNDTSPGVPVQITPTGARLVQTVTAPATVTPRLLPGTSRDLLAQVEVVAADGSTVGYGWVGEYSRSMIRVLPRQRISLRISGEGLQTRTWSVDGPGGAPTAFTLQPGEDRDDIVLPVVPVTGGSTVAGRITLDGAPLPGVSAFLVGRDGDAASGVTASDGSYRTGPVVPGSYGLQSMVCTDTDDTGWPTCQFPSVVRQVTVGADPVTGADLDLTPLPAAGTGSAQVGGTVRAGGSARLTLRDLPADLWSLSARWLLDGVPVGYVSDDLEPPAEWVGHRLSAVVVVSQQGHRSYRLHSDAVVVAPGQLRAPVPTISGSTVVGSRLTAVTGSWTPATTALAVRWLRDGRPIAGATARTHVLTAADRGHRISVTVTGSATGYVTARRTSAATTAVR